MRPVFGIPSPWSRTLAVVFTAPLLVGTILVAMQAAQFRAHYAEAAARTAQLIAGELDQVAPGRRAQWLARRIARGGDPGVVGLRLNRADGASPVAAGALGGAPVSATARSGMTLDVFMQDPSTTAIWLRGLGIAVLCSLVAAIAWVVAVIPAVRNFEAALNEAVAALRLIRQSNFNVRVRENDRGPLRPLQHSINATAAALDQARQRAASLVDGTTRELQETLEELEIKNVELDLARKRAVDDARAKSQFLANMSHEIRTPMNSIVGYAQLMADTPLSAAQRGYARSITQSARTLLEIIEDILSLSRLEAGKLTLVAQEFDIRRLGAQCMEMLAPAAYGQSLRLRTLIDPAVPTCFIGDALRIRQILVNFLTNAVKFTERGAVELRVDVKRQTRRNAVLVLTVTDTGRGIARRDRNRLFDAFTETSRRDFGGGAGLGLAIARSLTQAMDGQLSLDSEIDRGSSFCVRLPLKTDFDQRFEALDVLAGRRVCLALDDTVLADHLRRHFEACAMETVPLENWRAVASHGVAETTCDFVVVDVAVDDVDEFIETRASPPWQPIVLIASADNALLHRVDEATGGDALPAFSSATVVLARMARRLGQPIAQFEPDDHSAELPAVDGARVLIAEDDPLGRAWLVELLTRHGASVTACNDGRQAVELARQARFDVIFLDARMPVCDGEQAACLIRSQSLNQATPMYALTASALTADRHRFAAAGIDECLVKPAAPEALLKLVAAAHSRVTDDSPGNLAHRDEQMDALLRDELKHYRRLLRDEDITGVPTALFDVAHRLHGAAAICRLSGLERDAAHLEATARNGKAGERQRAIEVVLRRIDALLDGPQSVSTAAGADL